MKYLSFYRYVTEDEICAVVGSVSQVVKSLYFWGWPVSHGVKSLIFLEILVQSVMYLSFGSSVRGGRFLRFSQICVRI